MGELLTLGSPDATTTDVFHHTREVPLAWQADLETIVPKSEGVPWLQLVWQPGMPYEPVQRWEIYEMEPRLDHVSADFLEDIRGASPRTRGEWREDDTVPYHLGGKRWHSTSWHSLTQWLLFQAHNCYPVRFWILQGEKGGHIWRMDHIERNFALAIEGADVPLPGDLPYAEYTTATRDAIVELDRLRKWHQEMFQGFDTRTGATTAAEEAARKELYTNRMLAWLDNQIEEAASEIPRSQLPSLMDLPMGNTQFSKEQEEIDERLRKDRSFQSLKDMMEE